MLKIGAALALATVSVTALLFGGGAEQDPQPAVQRLLTAAETGDEGSFEAAIDRAAVREDLRRQLTALARQNGLDVGGPSDVVLDRMIAPEAVRAAAADAGDLKKEGKFRVCLSDGAECVLTFARGGEHSRWRLVAMEARHDQDHDLAIQTGG
jgi:hypothetical protein